VCTDLTQAREVVERGKFNAIVTTELPIVLTLRAPDLIMYVGLMFVVRILSLCRFDELPCHLTQTLCHGATTNHLVRMVERGRLQDTKFLHKALHDPTAQGWIEDAMRLDGMTPPPSIHINPSTEFPTQEPTHQKLRDATTGAWISPPDALTAIHLIFQGQSKLDFGASAQPNACFSKRDETPQYGCEVALPGLKDCPKIEEYGHSGLEALVSSCLRTYQIFQTNGFLGTTHFPTVYPFVPVPRTIEPQQTKKAKSNGVRTHPRRTPLFWTLSTETLGGLWHPTVVFIDGLTGEFGLLAILTRHPLPAISDFSLFISGNPVNVRLRKCRSGPLSPDELEKLRRATLRIMRFVGNKPFVCDINRLPYLLFPLEYDATLLNSLRKSYRAPEGHPRLGNPCVSGAVMNMAASAFVSITTDSTEEFIRDLDNAVIQDRKIEYTKHYFVDKVREDLTPLHKPQEGEVMVS